jgi:hypothetical protein
MQPLDAVKNSPERRRGQKEPNQTETKRNEMKRNETKRNETKRNETTRSPIGGVGAREGLLAVLRGTGSRA